MIAIVIFILILSLLIVAHEFGHFIAARRNGVRVEQFSLGFGPSIFKKKVGDTEYSLSLIPLGGYVKMAGDSQSDYHGGGDEYFSKAPGRRFQIIFCGPFLNYVLGFLFFWMIFFMGYPTLTTKVGGLVEGYGAKEAGLEVADKILEVDGSRVNAWEELQQAIRERKDPAAVNLKVLRGNREMEFNVPVRGKSLKDQLGEKHFMGVIGISPFDEVIEIRHGFLKSAWLGMKKTVDLTALTYTGLWRLVSGRMSMRDSMTGPLGIFFITSKAAKLGIIAVLHLMAVLSISLAIFNLLPLPILDGGHLFLLGLEKIRKRALGVKAEEVVNNLGFSLMIMLALFVTYNDILRLYGDKIGRMVVK
ncbi:MAG: RIP metalloprotease RseP [Candidatus Omnitrophica bacterium]|nr:RIP metalloprotease RseP [Candidatus Omnitrophota bacterium]MDD5077474.1 RIP metalloprotease RseP [Candidatus Omnitrophota bacterium]MDD5725533.1 RIP metalloprotease RseP [Candidatus Omnitrophota bacterium]